MEVEITINTENEAFERDGPDMEVARILRKLADAIEKNGLPEHDFGRLLLRDTNGNRVGYLSTSI